MKWFSRRQAWRDVLDVMSMQLAQILEGQGVLMATVDDLQTDLDNIKALVQKQTDLIATLTQNATSIPADVQAKIDALDAEAKAILGTPPV